MLSSCCDVCLRCAKLRHHVHQGGAHVVQPEAGWATQARNNIKQLLLCEFHGRTPGVSVTGAGGLTRCRAPRAHLAQHPPRPLLSVLLPSLRLRKKLNSLIIEHRFVLDPACLPSTLALHFSKESLPAWPACLV